MHDHRGSLVVLVDGQTHQPVESYRYTAFGEELSHTQLSPWKFASKRIDAETGFVYFGRRFYSPSLGRFITPDPQGFEDGPNLYAYLHNCPLTDWDLYGLWSCQGIAHDFLWKGAAYHLWDGFKGMGHTIHDMGKWMYANHQYEHHDERSFFHEKSDRSLAAWQNFGTSVKDAPISTTLGLFFPGVVETWKHPTSPVAWGKAGVDVALLALSATKIGRATSCTSRLGEASSLLGKAEISSIKSFPINRSTSFMGRRGHPLEYAPYQCERNIATNIRGRSYSGHSIDRMQDRGYCPSVIEDTITCGIRSPGRDAGTLKFYNPQEKFSVVVNEKTGNVITIIPGERR